MFLISPTSTLSTFANVIYMELGHTISVFANDSGNIKVRHGSD